jgi:alpha-galactosidase
VKVAHRLTVGLLVAAAMTALPAVGLTRGAADSVSADLAATPPMGWNSWNKFGCNVSDALIRATADAIVSSGMKDAGYEYLVIDDCWQVSRKPDGTIVPDPKRFPDMKALADYVHSKGLKFGIYSDAGTGTCQNRPGSHGYETQDAEQYAAWGVDYLKYDWCHHEGIDAKVAYPTMRKALDATGRPIVFSMCEWGSNQPWLWAQGVGHLWRATGDIQACWDCKKKWGGLGVTQIIDLLAPLSQYAGPHGWNDPDMLEVGNPGLTASENKAHFTMWAMLAAPLIAGNDIRSMPADVKEILTNKDVIAVDQDPLGKQGTRVRDDGDQEVWVKPLADGGEAIALLNRGAAPSEIKVNWSEAPPKGGASTMRDLWTHKEQPAPADGYSATVPSHGVVAFRIYPKKM